MNVYQRLNAAREAFHQLQLKKSGENKFAGYKYFELGDFLIPGLKVFKEHGLCATVSFEADKASMVVRNVEKPDEFVTFTSPMGSANLKGCHEVQNIGAVETYQRRYLWVAALEIVEHDAIDATTGADKTPAKSANVAQASGTISATRIAFDELPSDWQRWLRDFAPQVDDMCEQAGPQAAQDLIAENKLENDHIAGLFHLLSSKTRSAINGLTKSVPTKRVKETA